MLLLRCRPVLARAAQALYRLCRLYRYTGYAGCTGPYTGVQAVYRVCRLYTGYRPIYRCTGCIPLYPVYGLGCIPRISPVQAYVRYMGLYRGYRPVYRGVYRDRPSTLDPRTILDNVANPRTIEWFVSARGRMRAAAGAHYARARVYRRPHARGRYVGPNPWLG